MAAAVKTWSDPDSPRRVWVAELPDFGVVGIGELKRTPPSCREIAYAVRMIYRGQGLGSEIGRLLVAFAFADASIERVQATCDPRNAGSAGVVRRIGMTIEGRLRHTSGKGRMARLADALAAARGMAASRCWRRPAGPE